ncbi:MAG: TerC family protein [Phycisphaerae bacterium]|jgi:tellurite resistance protein TerC
MALLWLSFIVFIIALVMLDLFVLRALRKNTDLDKPEPIGTHVAFATLWLVLGMLFTFAVFFLYKEQIFSAGVKDNYTEALKGTDATLQYLSAFILELVLSIDSVFVIAAVFAAFGVRTAYQHRLLFWGMLLALAIRALVILGVGELLHALDWVRFILAAALGIAALRMIVVRKENLDPQKNIAYRLINKFFPFKRSDTSDLLIVQNGKPAITPLLIPLILIETADVFLAIDSIPASFAFSREPFLIFAGSCFAMLVVRSLIPVLSRIVDRLRYFKLGLAAILVYSAVVIAMPASRTLAGYASPDWKLTAPQKLAFLGFAILFGLVIAFIVDPRQTRAEVSPLGEDADRVVRSTLSNVRKAIIFTVGIIGLVGGAIMAIGPGPGIPVLFIAALLLASEFVWARRIVNKYRQPAEKATLAAAQQARKRGPWLLITLMSGTVVIATLVAIFTKVPVGLVIAAAVPMLAGQAFLGYLAFFYKPAETQASERTSERANEGESKARQVAEDGGE